MSTSNENESESDDYVDESDCILPSGTSGRTIQAEYQQSVRQQGWWKNRPQKPGQNEARRKRWQNRLANDNSLFKYAAENHSKTLGGIEQAQAERKRLEALHDDPPPF